MISNDNEISSLTLSIESAESNDDISPNNKLNNNLYQNKKNLDLFYELDSLLDNKSLGDNCQKNNIDVKFLKRKNYLINHVEDKLNKLETKIRLVEMKNTEYKSCYNCVNISIIIMSTLLTFLESFKAIYINKITENDQNLFIKYTFDMLPIGIGSIITCSASILKFKKYQEKMENICKILESASISIINLKKTREKLVFCDNLEKYNNIYNNFNNDIYENYINISQSFDRILKKKDYDINLSDIYLTEYRIKKLNNEREYFSNMTDIDDKTKEIIQNKLNNTPNKKKCCISNI